MSIFSASASIARNAILRHDSPPEASPSNGDADQPGAFLSDVDMKPPLPFDKQLDHLIDRGLLVSEYGRQSAKQHLAEPFDRDAKTIGKHINNALQEELEGARDRVVAKYATTAAVGKVQTLPIGSEDCPHSEWTIFAATDLVDASLGGAFR